MTTTTIELPTVKPVIKDKIKSILDNGFTDKQSKKISKEKAEVFASYGDDTTADDLRDCLCGLLPQLVFTNELLDQEADAIETCLSSDAWEAVIANAIWEVPHDVEDGVDELLVKINALSVEDRQSLLNHFA